MSEDEIYNYLIYFVSRKIKQNKLDLRDMAGFNLGYLSTEELQKAVQGLLDLYNKEKETSHFIQSQLDEANAKLIEEKEKNKKIEDKIKMETNRLKEHGYWEFLEQRDLDKTISIIQNLLEE